MYRVQYYDEYDKRWVTSTRLIDGRKKVHCEFAKRQQVRVYIRNHESVASQWRIVNPDGTKEPYENHGWRAKS